MLDKFKDLEKINNLKHLEDCYVNFFEEGGGHVYLVNDIFILFEIGQYGSYENYHNTYKIYEGLDLLDEVYSWT